MEVEITDAKRGTGLGTLVFAGRKTWESKVEDLNKKLGS
jgi:hypothetical protein